MDFKSLLASERARAKAKRELVAGEGEGEAPPPAFASFVDTPTTSCSFSRDLGFVRGLAYKKEFLGESDARAVERALLDDSYAMWWTEKSDGRRVMNVGGVSPSTLFRDGDEANVPKFINLLIELLRDRHAMASSAKANYVLVNEYECGSGVDAHSDGDAYEDDVAIITLRGGALIEFWPENDETPSISPVASLYLEPRSLVAYSRDAYRLRHGIRKTEIDVVDATCANAEELGLKVGDRIERNPNGRVSMVFVRKRRAGVELSA